MLLDAMHTSIPGLSTLQRPRDFPKDCAYLTNGDGPESQSSLVGHPEKENIHL